jgi:hypothetical protein
MDLQRSGKTAQVTGASLRIGKVTVRSCAKGGCDVAPDVAPCTRDRACPDTAADLRVLGDADWEQALQLKFMGYVRCLRDVFPITVAQGQGASSTGSAMTVTMNLNLKAAPAAASSTGWHANDVPCGQHDFPRLGKWSKAR